MSFLTPFFNFLDQHYFTLYLTKQVIRIGIDNFRSYPSFQKEFDKYEVTLSGMDLYFLFYSIFKFKKDNEINFFPTRSEIRANDFIPRDIIAKGFIPSLVGASYGSMLAVNKIYNHVVREDLESYKITLSPQKKENLTLTWDRPCGESFSQGLICAEILMAIAQAYFSGLSKSCVALLSLQFYSLYAVTWTPWIKIERKLEKNKFVTDNFRLNRVISRRVDHFVFSYYFLMLPHPHSPENEICTICQEDKPDTFYCANHLFHKHCLIGHFYSQSDNVLLGARVNAKIQEPFEDLRSLRFILQECNLPSCANCRGLSLRYTYDILSPT